MGKIALWGGGGAVGHSIAEALRAQGTPYRIVGRSKAALDAAFAGDPLAETVAWNPDDEASIRRAAEGVETIVYLVGVPYWEFRLHPILMRKTLAGAKAAGVARMLLIGTVYPYGPPKTPTVREDHPREPNTFKGKMRKEQEDLLVAAHTAGSIAGAVLRLPDFYGPGVEKSFLANAFHAAKQGKRAQLLGPIDRPHEYVFVPDVGPLVCRMLREPRVWGETWHFAGPAATTVRSLVEEIYAQAGRKPSLMVADNWLVRLMGLFSPMMREVAEMHYLLTDPILLNDDKLRTLLGGLQKTPYKEGIRRTLAAS